MGNNKTYCQVAAQPDLHKRDRSTAGYIAAGYVAVLFVALMLGACGFHLRGSVAISESLSPVFVQDNGGSQIKPVLNQLLDINHIRIAQNGAEANAVVVIQNEQFQRRVSSVGAAGKVQEFELQYLLLYSVFGQGNVPLLAQQQLRITRDLRFDENAVLAKAQEEEQRNKDMVMDAAQQLLRRLQSVSQSNSKTE